MNANVNFCGVIILLRKLVASGHCTKKEANRIAARIAKQTGADIILSILGGNKTKTALRLQNGIGEGSNRFYGEKLGAAPVFQI